MWLKKIKFFSTELSHYLVHTCNTMVDTFFRLQNIFLSSFGIFVLFSHGNSVFMWHPSIQPKTFGNELSPRSKLNLFKLSVAAWPYGQVRIKILAATLFKANKQLFTIAWLVLSATLYLFAICLKIKNQYNINVILPK